jgi:hypothetical protein
MEKLSHDVMRISLQLPSTENMQFHAGQYVEFLLRDGSRRAYSMANAPHTLVAGAPIIDLHIRHMPGGKFTDHVFGSMKEKEIQRVEAPFGSFYLREDSESPMVLLDRTHATPPDKTSCLSVLGRSTARRFVHARLGHGPMPTHAAFAICARRVRCFARRPLARSNRFCSCGCVARYS